VVTRVSGGHRATGSAGRPAQPDEIADTVFVIASDRARFFTGQVLCVIGGHVASKPFNDGPRHAMVFGQLRE
jgi:NAD(P)-dependent dehydrogenase (short-subunit alcohol dehydrogenase family)